MKEAINILQSVLNTELNVNTSELSERQWTALLSAFLDYNNKEEDALNLINQNLKDHKLLQGKVDSLQSEFMDELAENMVLYPGNFKESNLNKSEELKKRKAFFHALQRVIYSVERDQVKGELDHLTEKAEFEPDENIMAKAVRRSARDDLKKKLQGWDKELKGNQVAASKAPSAESYKFSWKILAVAASLLLIGGLIYIFNNLSTRSYAPPPVVSAPPEAGKDFPFGEGDDDQLKDLDENHSQSPKQQNEIKLAALKIESTEKELMEPLILGYTGSQKEKINFTFISTIERQQDLDKYLVDYKGGQGGRALATGPKYHEISTELEQWENKKGKYIYNGDNLVFYDSDLSPNKLELMVLDNKLYMYNKESNTFYLLIKSEAKIEFNNPEQEVNSLEEINNQEIIDGLEKILFDNNVD